MIAPMLAAAAVALAPTPAPTFQPAPAPVVRADSEQWDITSKITGRTYRIYVAVPSANQPPSTGPSTLETPNTAAK